MRTLKLIIVGQILLVLTKFYQHQELFTEEERQDYQDLMNCQKILAGEK